jgi:putative transposase
VFIPKYRRKAIYRELRRELGGVFGELAEQKESQIEEGHLVADHVHMLISIPPKYSVAQVVGFLKGKSAIHLARNFGGRKKNLVLRRISWVWGRIFLVQNPSLVAELKGF